jgi:hypothetical protein
MKNSLKLTLFLVLLVFLSGCIKTQTEAHLDLLSRKDGVWNVDKFTVNWFHPNAVYAIKTEVYENEGELIFKKNGEDLKMTFTGSIPLESGNLGPFYELQTDITSSILDGITFFKIVYLDKKKLRLFAPRLTNTIFTQLYDYSFYIECSKK